MTLRPWPRPRVGLVLLVALTVTVSVALAQRRGRGGLGGAIEPNAPYDGQFAFVRLRYQEYGPAGWAFDYPQMERNFMTILQDLTTIGPHLQESNVFLMDDPELFNHPIAYLSEPGYWLPSDLEAAGRRDWIHKGGFLIVDDFYFNQWTNFERAMSKVLPDGRIHPVPLGHPVFDSFFRIASLDGMHHPSTQQARAEYLGIYEANDPSRRLMVIINYNNDIGDYMEWSGEGWYPVNMSNDAYKFATNYLIYGLSR
ncbi:MAG: DUF4159 domain-containing protein [Gemmatimonadota bacterium]|nr:DUF4159 domain-containing protein [Gemmatimonadota bacterium]